MGWSLSEVKDFKLGCQGGEKTNQKICPQPFYSLSINFNGLVSVCCVDWSWGTIVGDVKGESLVSIWNGEKMKQFRITHLRGEKNKLKPCANCHYSEILQPIKNLVGLDLIAKYLLLKLK